MPPWQNIWRQQIRQSLAFIRQKRKPLKRSSVYRPLCLRLNQSTGYPAQKDSPSHRQKSQRRTHLRIQCRGRSFWCCPMTNGMKDLWWKRRRIRRKNRGQNIRQEKLPQACFHKNTRELNHPSLQAECRKTVNGFLKRHRLTRVFQHLCRKLKAPTLLRLPKRLRQHQPPQKRPLRQLPSPPCNPLHPLPRRRELGKQALTWTLVKHKTLILWAG